MIYVGIDMISAGPHESASRWHDHLMTISLINSPSIPKYQQSNQAIA